MKVKNFASVLLVWFLLTFRCLGLELPSEVIKRNQSSESIDALKKTLKASEIEAYTGTDRGGSLKFYTQDRMIKNIVLEIGLSNKDIYYSLYYENSVCFLIKKTERLYKVDEKSLEIDFTKISGENSTCYYYEGNKLFFTLNTQSGLLIATEEAEDQWLKNLSKELSEAVKSGKKKLDLQQVITR